MDDEPDTLAFLTMLFEDSGYAIVTTNTPENVMDLVRIETPDLITLDILMPNKTGVNVYRELRTSNEFQTLPIIVISGVNPSDYIRNGPGANIPDPDAVIEKPVDSHTLLQTVNQLLK